MDVGSNSNPEALPRFADVQAAAARIRAQVRRTPVLNDPDFDAQLGCEVHFKCENLQYGGAFKLRGATNAVLGLTDAQARRGVVTHSSGNHGAALARAARRRAIACHVVVPQGAVAAKLRNMEAQGAILHFCAPTMAAREATTARVLAETGGVLVPPFDDADVIAGQGTAALELVEDVPGLTALIAPVGGGGLLAGTALVGRAQAPPLRVFGAEPAGAADAAASLARGARVTDRVPHTIADGLRATLGVRNFALIARHVEAIWTVSEEAIVAAQHRMWEQFKLLIEPSSAVAVAALLQQRAAVRGQRVGLILTGGNVDLEAVPLRRRLTEPG
jgi:threonine dehydratase